MSKACQIPFDAFKHVLVKYSDVVDTTDPIEGFGIVPQDEWLEYVTDITAKVDPIPYSFGVADDITITYANGAAALLKFTATELSAPEIEVLRRLFDTTMTQVPATFYQFGHFPLQVLIDAVDA